MSYRKGALVSVALVLAFAMFLAPVPSDGASVNSITCSDVTMVIFSDGIDMNTAESYPISIEIYNGHSTPVTVKISKTGTSVIDLSVPSDEVLLKPEESVKMAASLTTDRYTPKGDYEMTVSMSVMDGTSEPQGADMVIPISVTSNYSSGEKYNRFFGYFDNDLPAPYNTAVSTAILTFLMWIGIGFAAVIVFILLLKAIFKIIERDSDTLGRNTMFGVFFCVVLAGINNCCLIAGASEHVVEEVKLVTGTLNIIAVALIVWDVYKAFITSALQKLEKKGSGLDTTLIPLFKAIGRIVIVVMCVALILSSFGVNFVTLIASAGLTGLGLSFGVKPAINELFSGIIVLTTRPFKVGDYVTIGSDDRLQVAEIGVLRTKFVTGYTMEYATMPNSKIASSKIVNISHNTTMYRNTVSVKVPFNSNLTLIKKIVKRVAMDHPNVVTDGSVPKPNAVFSSCEDGSAIIMTLAFYVRDYEDNMSTACQLREGILREFKERDIIIPYNKLEISVFKGGQTDAQ